MHRQVPRPVHCAEVGGDVKRIAIYPVLVISAIAVGIVAAIDVLRLVRREANRQVESKRWADERLGRRSQDWSVN